MDKKKGDERMDDLSFAIGQNIRKYRKLRGLTLGGLTLEKLADVLETETNYLGQCERGERRFSLDKLIRLIQFFGVTANDIIPVPQEDDHLAEEKAACLQEIHALLEGCTPNQLAVIRNLLKETVPFLKG